jgi:hypothetical protein
MLHIMPTTLAWYTSTGTVADRTTTPEQTLTTSENTLGEDEICHKETDQKQNKKASLKQTEAQNTPSKNAKHCGSKQQTIIQ